MGGTPATHGVALAAAPWQRSPGSAFVRLRSRRPNPPNAALDASRSRHRSAVVAGLGLSRRVAERRRATLPQGRVSSASVQPALTCPGSRCLGQPARSVQARYGFRCTESSCPPAAGRRTAPRSLSPKGKRRGRDACCVRPKCSVVSAVLVLQRPALKLLDARIAVAYPAQREADGDASRAVDGKAEPSAVDLPHAPRETSRGSGTGGSRPSTWRARCRPA